MKNSYKKAIVILLAAVATSSISQAQNPIIQTSYTADPAPLVYNDKVYLYTGHDEDGSKWFTMNAWKLYTTSDMVNWTDHGDVLSFKDFSWAKGDAWAAHCAEKDGKFYWYVTLTSRYNNRPAIGVAVADSPYGPFIDPLGKPLAQSGHGDIDPAVFIDDDGQAYLYWGNPNCYYVKLNEDMISYDGEIIKVPMTEEAFGKREGNPERPTLYEEGPWLHKRNGLYYMLWAGGPIPEHIGYSTSESPTGPWKYAGKVMPTEGGSFTNHPGVVDFKGETYFFYHNAGLPGGSGFTRSVCVEKLSFEKDGSISQLKMTEGITSGLKPVNPYRKTEAETIAWSEGIKASQNKEVGVFVTATRNDAYIKVKNVDFRSHGSSKFTARVGTTLNSNANMEVRLDSPDGKLLASIKVPITGGNDRWALVSAEIPKVTGTHDLFFVFNNSNIFFDYWMFSK
jgi:Beta-xylosidase